MLQRGLSNLGHDYMDRMSGFEHRTGHFPIDRLFAIVGPYKYPRSVRGVKGMSSDGLGHLRCPNCDW